jgi:hypothetical protein
MHPEKEGSRLYVREIFITKDNEEYETDYKFYKKDFNKTPSPFSLFRSNIARHY